MANRQKPKDVRFLPYLIMVGCGISAPFGLQALALAFPAIVTVEQHGRMFHPSQLTIDRGQSVAFSNTDPYDHQIYVTSPDFNYESGLQPPGSINEITFTEAGTFQVLCAIHPRMMLQVDVH